MWRLRDSFDRVRPDFPAGTPFWRDPSFETLLARCNAFQALREYLPSDLNRISYQGQESVEAAHSTYKDHGYGNFFYALGRAIRPQSCLELGVLNGFSMLSVAAALRDNGAGKIQGIDLFDDYPHRHGQFVDVEKRIRDCRLENWTGITQADALLSHAHHERLDYLHVDLSNDGDTYHFVFRHWAGKVNQVILLEGGSADRDQVEWMVKHKKTPIVPAIEEIRRAHPEWSIVVLAPFPSLTVAMRSACVQR